MRKIIILIWALTASLCAAAQQPSSLRMLKETTTMFNSALPMSLGSGMTWDGVALRGDRWVLTYTWTMDMPTDQTFGDEKHIQSAKNAVLSMGTSDPQIGMVFDQLIANNISVEMKIAFPKIGKDLNVIITPDELSGYKNASYDVLAVLNAQVDAVNKLTPIDYHNGMIAVKMDVDNQFLTQYFEADEEILSMKTLADRVELIREEVIKSLASSALNMVLMEQAKSANLLLKMIYTGNITGKKVEIVITPAEVLARSKW